MRRGRLVFLALLGVIAALGACGTAAIDVDDCRTIEDAICTRAIRMSCPESYLPHPADDLSECIRYYSTACLHGLATTIAPMKAQVTSCVAALQTTNSCVVLGAPQEAPECAWLIPPEAGVDAEADAAADAAPETAVADAASDALADAD